MIRTRGCTAAVRSIHMRELYSTVGSATSRKTGLLVSVIRYYRKQASVPAINLQFLSLSVVATSGWRVIHTYRFEIAKGNRIPSNLCSSFENVKLIHDLLSRQSPDREKEPIAMNIKLNRRAFFGLASASLARAQEPITRPVVSEEACPAETIAPVARDGYRGRAVLRKPPGAGQFPAILWIHPGLLSSPQAALLNISRRSANPSRFLAAGYVVTLPTYRSRDDDPQSGLSLQDCLAAVDHVRRQPYVDPKSIVIYGCSGGGDLALEIAAATDVCAIVPEEPASVLMAGILNTRSPKKGERYTPLDAEPIFEKPKQFYTPEYQHVLRAKIDRIKCPILILQGDDEIRGVSVNKFNADVLYPNYAPRARMSKYSRIRASRIASVLRVAGPGCPILPRPGKRTRMPPHFPGDS
jgi:acetyl esterase/lipase